MPCFALFLYRKSYPFRGVSTPHRTEGAVNQTYIHFIEQGCGGDEVFPILYSLYYTNRVCFSFPSLSPILYIEGYIFGGVFSPLFGRGRKGGVKGGRYSI